jgi:hypothetical protein
MQLYIKTLDRGSGSQCPLRPKGFAYPATVAPIRGNYGESSSSSAIGISSAEFLAVDLCNRIIAAEIAMEGFRLALAQINSTVGDFEANGDKLLHGMRQAEALGADLVAFPELAITGYPPEDLLLKSSFLEANMATLETVAAQCGNTAAVVGYVESSDDVYNAACFTRAE